MTKPRHITKRYFSILIVSYVTIFIVPLCAAFFTYYYARQATEAECYRANTAVLELARSYIDGQISQIKDLRSNVALNDRIDQFLNVRTVDENERYQLYAIVKDMSVLKNRFPFISDYYIYFKHSDIVVTPASTYSSKMFYDHVYDFNSLTYEDWTKLIANAYHKNTLISPDSILQSQGSNYLTYITSLPVALYQSAQANLVIMVDVKNISDFLSSLHWIEDGMIYILDQSGHVVAASDDSLIPDFEAVTDIGDEQWKLVEINDEQMMVSSVTAQEQGWRYVALLPTRVYSAQLDNIKRLSTILLLLSLAVGFAMITFWARRSYFPVRNIMKLLPEPESVHDEFAYIRRRIEEMQEEKQQNKIFEEQKPIVRNNLLMSLLEGIWELGPPITNSLCAYDVSFPHDYFIVITFMPDFELDTSEVASVENRWALYQAALAEYLKLATKWAGVCTYICEAVHQGGFVLLCNMSENWSEDTGSNLLESRLNDIQTFFAESFGQKYFIGVGSVYTGEGISRSYSESKKALEHRIQNGKHIQYYSESIELDQNFYYPIETERQLLNSLKAGDLERSTSVFDYVMVENMQKRTLSIDRLHSLFYDIINTIAKAFGDLKITDKHLRNKQNELYRQVERYESFDEIKSLFHSFFAEICHFLSANKESRGNRLLKEVVAYVDAACCDPQLSLSSVAEAMNITGPYLSRFFKEQLGVNFNSYLNLLRMDRAKIMLLSGDDSIAVIAAAVGFTNDVSFIRVFKKIMGDTPGNYRKERLEIQPYSVANCE